MEGAGSGLGLQKERVTKPLCLFCLCQSLGQPRRELPPASQEGSVSLVPWVEGVSLALGGSPFPLHPGSCPFSLSPPFSLQKLPGLSSLGRKRSRFPLLQRRLKLALCVRHWSPVLQCDYQKEEFCEGFFFQARRGAFSYFPCFPTDFHSQFMVCCGNASRRGLLDLVVKA